MPPVPKRSDQRRRRNKVDIDRVDMADTVEAPELELEFAHPIAIGFYESLKISGQSRYYEPSDWQRARLMCFLLSDLLYSGSKPSSMMYTAIQADMSALLTSEADRRRMRMEIDRAPRDTSAEDAKVRQMDAYRRAADQPPAG